MKISNYVMIFIIVLTSITMFIVFTTKINTTISEEDEKYREMLYSAAEDALVKAVQNENYYYQNDVLWTPENRQIATDSLNDHFETRLDYSINSVTDTTDWLFPIICYLDYNGFYITYIGTENDGTAAQAKVDSGLNTWSKVIEEGSKKYNIIYYLGKDILSVTDETGITFTGTYDEVNEYYSYPNFLKSYTEDKAVNGEIVKKVNADRFNQDKENFIILKTEELLNYYLNNKDTTVNKLGKHLELNFDLNDDGLHKTFHNVGIAIFMQGPVMNNSYNKTPICGYAHYQVTENSDVYDITLENSELYYHNQNCTIKDSQTLYKRVFSLTDALNTGASPCPICY